MVYGEANISTNEQKVVLKTTQVTGEIYYNSNVYVRTNDQKTEVTASRGGGNFDAGGKKIQLSAHEKLGVEKGGSVSKVTVLAAPRLLDPANNKTLSFSSGMRIKLQWEKVPGAGLYWIQISSSQFFVDLLAENKKSDNTQSLKITAPADYYWRVSAIDAKGVAGTPSNSYKFKVVPSGQNINGDKTPPPLTADAGSPLGNMCIIRGQTEPGVTVTVDGEEAFMKEDGSFTANATIKNVGWNVVVVKAVDPAGNETVKPLKIFNPDY